MRLCDSWNAGEWLGEYAAAGRLPGEAGMRAGRELLRRVFWTTVEAACSRRYVLPDGRTVEIPVPGTLHGDTRLYSHEIFPEAGTCHAGTQVDVVEDDCLAVAERLLADGERPAVLSMASASNPGGGVHEGAGAQEGYLFRVSNYFQSLYQFADFGGMYGVDRNPEQSYPLDPDFGGVFSRGVTIFRGRQEEGHPFLEKPWKVDFIAVSALSWPDTVVLPDGSRRLADRLVPQAKNKIRTIFNIAIDNGVKSLVLGAFGCGVLENPPEHIARLFKEILDEPRYRNAFLHVVFAIKQDHNSQNGSDGRPLFQIFRDELAPEPWQVPNPLPGREFVEAFNAAGMRIEETAARKGMQVSWLKCVPYGPSAEHMSFFLGSQAYMVRIADADGKAVFPGSMDRLLRMAREWNGFACVFPVSRRRDGSWAPVSGGWNLFDATDGKSLDPCALALGAPPETTPWELHDFAVKVVRDQLEEEGRTVLSWSSDPGMFPSLWFKGDGDPEWVAVVEFRYPCKAPQFPCDRDALEKFPQVARFTGHLAEVRFESPLQAGSTEVLPLLRGEATEIDFESLKPFRK